MKTSKLSGAALDWAVAQCELLNGADYTLEIRNFDGTLRVNFGGMYPEWSTDWHEGGAIIEREGINLDNYARNPKWCAWTPAPEQATGEAQADGPTLLIAAMRCYVASKLGDDVEVPADLFQ